MSPSLLYTVYGTFAVLLLGVAFLGRHSFRRRRFLGGCFAVLAALVVLLLATQSEPKPRFLFADFSHAYYPAGRLIHSNPEALYNRKAMRFVNLPILAYLFTPLSLVGEPAARVLFTAGGLAAVVGAWHLLSRMTGASGWTRALLLGVVLLNGPLYYSFREGNLTHFVLWLVVAALAGLERGREVRAGILLGLAALIKLPLFLLGLCFLLRRRWRVLAGAGGTVVLVFGLSLLLCGGKLHRTWRSEALLPFVGRPLIAFNVQSASSFLARLTTDRNPDTSPWGIYESWKPLEVGWTFMGRTKP
jgi:alpha-1,2-mannosyltransferase